LICNNKTKIPRTFIVFINWSSSSTPKNHHIPTHFFLSYLTSLLKAPPSSLKQAQIKIIYHKFEILNQRGLWLSGMGGTDLVWMVDILCSWGMLQQWLFLRGNFVGENGDEVVLRDW